MPKGWRIGKLEDVAFLSKASVNPAGYPNKEFFHYSLPAFDEGKLPARELGRTILSQKFVVKKNCILLSKLNPRFPRIWAINDIDETNSICSTEFLVLQPKKPLYYSFINCFLRQDNTVSTMKGLVTGTSGSHQRIKPDDVKSLEIIIPNDETIEKFEGVTRTFFQRSSEIIYENQTLTQIRNGLLPKLMSGKIKVGEVEKELDGQAG
jgi:type I restriction enzyme S subunit